MYSSSSGMDMVYHFDIHISHHICLFILIIFLFSSVCCIEGIHKVALIFHVNIITNMIMDNNDDNEFIMNRNR